MNKKIAILHTTPVTVEPLKKLAEDIIPTCTVINFVDDSILPQLAEHEGDVRLVEERLIQYAIYAEQVGADIILNACSSVGEVVQKMRKEVSIPIVRIDEAMAEKAIQRASKIGVAATLATTLMPTMELLKSKSMEFNKSVEFESLLAEEAYQYVLVGNKEKHDQLLAESLSTLAEKVDVVVLAQASMASVVATLPTEQQNIFLSSPELGMKQVRESLEGLSQ